MRRIIRRQIEKWQNAVLWFWLLRKNRNKQEYINTICELYNDIYDDRLENTCPLTDGNTPCPLGEDWVPGQCAEHKSLSAFQWELQENGISLSTSKIKKILITGGYWTTARSREIQELYSQYICEGLKPNAVMKQKCSKM